MSADRIHEPNPHEAQLTARAVLVGALIGGVVAASNVYVGLRLGWTVGGSLIAAILGFAVFRIVPSSSPYTVLEANITQTVGSGAGTMASAAGLVAPIPALAMLGHHVPWYVLFAWALSVAFLGVCFTVPLRRTYVEVAKLRFPTGTATATTIVAMFASTDEAAARARALATFAVGAGAFTLAGYFVPVLHHPPVAGLGLAVLVKWTFVPYLSPLMFGTGLLVGIRVGASLLAGAIVAWGILGPLAQNFDWAPGKVMSTADGPRGWLLWIGVAVMVAESLTTLLLSWRTVLQAFSWVKQRRRNVKDARTAAASADSSIPKQWWLGGLCAAASAAIVVAWLFFDVPLHLGIIAVALSAILANVAVRAGGETDLNPIGPMAKVTQVIFGALAPRSLVSNLMAGAMTGAGAAQAGDMMQDLKAGYLLGASPRQQYIAQLCGIAAGVLFCVPIYYLFDHAYTIGQGELAAPSAHSWKAIALVLSQGLNALPSTARWAAAGGALFGVLLAVVQKKLPRLAPYTPSGLAFGIAFLIPAYYSLAMFVGALILVFWNARQPAHAKRFTYVVACGLIAGEAIMGIVKAVLRLCAVPPLLG